jgi:hypothetical protein
MWSKRYHNVRTVTKSNHKNVEIEAKLIPITHVYMTAHLPDWYQ